jgi:hypothetical protein
VLSNDSRKLSEKYRSRERYLKSNFLKTSKLTFVIVDNKFAWQFFGGVSPEKFLAVYGPFLTFSAKSISYPYATKGYILIDSSPSFFPHRPFRRQTVFCSNQANSSPVHKSGYLLQFSPKKGIDNFRHNRCFHNGASRILGNFNPV